MSHEDHAELSPSSSGRWLTCLGSVPLSRGHYTDVESEYAKEGTDHHEVGALCLENGWDTKVLIGKPMVSGALLTEDGAEHIQFYLDTVRGYVETNKGSLCVEEEVSIEFLTGESNGRGKADAVVVLPIPELIVADLKYGMGVEVDPEDNTQLMLYGAGVIEKHQLWDEIKQVRLVIIQPRISGERVKEWVCSIDRLKEFCEYVKVTCKQIASLVGGRKYLGGANKNVLREAPADTLEPSEKACKFCPAKASCPALFQAVERVVTSVDTDGFNNEDAVVAPQGMSLGEAMDMTELVEIWLHAVRAKVELELLAGKPVQGKDGFYKLVRGRKGPRRWSDVVQAEASLKLILDESEMYEKSLISAPTAEKLFKKTPDVWKGLADTLVTQSDGSLSVASPTDKRPAVQVEKPTEGLTEEPGGNLL